MRVIQLFFIKACTALMVVVKQTYNWIGIEENDHDHDHVIGKGNGNGNGNGNDNDKDNFPEY